MRMLNGPAKIAGTSISSADITAKTCQPIGRGPFQAPPFGGSATEFAAVTTLTVNWDGTVTVAGTLHVAAAGAPAQAIVTDPL